MAILGSRALTFILELILGFITWLLLAVVSIVGMGVEAVLGLGYDYESLFGFDYHIFMPAVIGISCIISLLMIGYDIVKDRSGIESEEPKSMIGYLKGAILAIILNSMLPIFVLLLQVISDAFVKYLGTVMTAAMKIEMNQDGGMNVLTNAAQRLFAESSMIGNMMDSMEAVGRFLITLFFLIVMVIGFCLLGVSMLKRYVEILIAMMFYPFISMTAYKNFDRLNSWLGKVSQIFVGYMLNVFLFYLMEGMVSTVLSPEITLQDLMIRFFLLLAVISVAMSGSQAVREYVMSTGTGNKASSVPNMLMYNLSGGLLRRR